MGAQNADGSWGTGVLEGLSEYGFSVASFPAWQVASHALALLALAQAEDTPERAQALDRGLDWLLATAPPERGSEWDNDAVWAYLYGFAGSLALLEDARFAGDERLGQLEQLARHYLAELERNQTPDGGWGYYDDPPWARRPQWSTSFCTALVLPSLARALERGWLSDPAVLARALANVQRCALPDGAYEYDLNALPRINGGEHINRLRGSLGRTQVCNWARARCGDPRITPERIREGLDAFFEHHRFLDVARLRPIPHEAYYYNAGYFYFFGHYYAAQAIELLPEDQREPYRARLRPHLVKTLWKSGATSDFLGTSSMVTASTSFLVLALELGLQETSAP